MEEAAIQASEAGVDIDMMSPAYMLCLEKLVESGKNSGSVCLMKVHSGS